jgi:hypothetical protein
MDKLKANRAIEFHMIYHVPSAKFEKIEMIKSDASREILGNA